MSRKRLCRFPHAATVRYFEFDSNQLKTVPSINRYIIISNYDEAGLIIRKCSPRLRAQKSIFLENLPEFVTCLRDNVYIRTPSTKAYKISFEGRAL